MSFFFLYFLDTPKLRSIFCATGRLNSNALDDILIVLDLMDRESRFGKIRVSPVARCVVSSFILKHMFFASFWALFRSRFTQLCHVCSVVLFGTSRKGRKVLFPNAHDLAITVPRFCRERKKQQEYKKEMLAQRRLNVVDSYACKIELLFRDMIDPIVCTDESISCDNRYPTTDGVDVNGVHFVN